MMMRSCSLLTLIFVSFVTSASVLSSISNYGPNSKVDRTQTLIEMDNLVDRIMHTLRSIQAGVPEGEVENVLGTVKKQIEETKLVTAKINQLAASNTSHTTDPTDSEVSSSSSSSVSGTELHNEDEEGFGIPDGCVKETRKRSLDGEEDKNSLKSNRIETFVSPAANLSQKSPSESLPSISSRLPFLNTEIPPVSLSSSQLTPSALNLTPEEIRKRILTLSAKMLPPPNKSQDGSSSSSSIKRQNFSIPKTANPRENCGLLFSQPDPSMNTPGLPIGKIPSINQLNVSSKTIQSTDSSMMNPVKISLPNGPEQELIQLLSDTNFMPKLSSVIQTSPNILKRPIQNGKTLFEIAVRRHCANNSDKIALFNINILLGSGFFEMELSDKTSPLSFAIQSNDFPLVATLLKIPVFKESIDGIMLGAAMHIPAIYELLLNILI